ncbi:AraC family transcriptional regulator [Rugamonas apoptosis]|uniref:AraC family transcriptional regulator n=1 Tax=Rugamonas apoptosis TaxID=2758570 RepID=A0A7W2FC41_9BURK|nr:AraC family transcriptional regulator [Rugamonas apoptosis]MBA5688887.1 AraC family transcriptional regulator [Rugamonas apoptosis]
MGQLSLTLSSGFVNAFLAAAEAAGDDAVSLRQQAGIADDVLREPGGRVTEDQFVALYRLLAEKYDDELPKLLSHPVRGGALKFGVLSIINAPTMGVALYRYTRFLRLAVHDFQIELIHSPDISRIVIEEPAGGRRCKTMAIEMVLKVIHGLASWLVGREVRLLRVDFAFDRPSYAQEFQNLFPGPVFFNQPASQIVLASDQLSLRIQRIPRDVKPFIARLPRDWIFVSFKDSLVTHQVREQLMKMGAGNMTVDEIAEALHMSARTLCRKLEAEQTSFKKVRDDLRRDLAVELLNNSNATMFDIAQELGFGEVSSFHRAFRAWTGATPGAYRQIRDD